MARLRGMSTISAIIDDASFFPMVEKAQPDYASYIETRLAELRSRTSEVAAPVMSPLDPGFDDSQRINVPEDHVTTSFFKQEAAPAFEKLSKDRLAIMLKQQYLALQQAESALTPAYERYRAMFLDGITNVGTAIQATRAVSPGLIRTLPITFDQMNGLMTALRDRVNRYNVPVPENWSIAVETIDDEEDGDDES